MPSMIYADESGEIFDLPDLCMAGRSGRLFHPVELKDLIPLPEGSELFVLPETMPVGWDSDVDEMVVVDQDPSGSPKPVRAVAAFVSPAYTQTASTAFYREEIPERPLPLFAYSAVGWLDGQFYVAAFRSDPDPRQDFKNFNQKLIRKNTLTRLKQDRDNRLIQHLGKCSLTYGCPAARNLFMKRWECPLPTSPVCNARCLGCLSLQPEDGPPATQDRITFVPHAEEVAGVAVPHLKKAKRAVASFGQGCEGEPLMQSELLEESIRLIRSRVRRGTVNLNSNASRPDALSRLIDAGLDSMRISMNSVREKYYTSYYRPKGYSYSDVLESWRIMKEAGRYVSLNLFVLPGLTDEMAEIDHLSEIIAQNGLDLIQLRNHNIDPDWYLDSIGYEYSGMRTGVQGMVKILKKRFPKLQFGYFNPPLDDRTRPKPTIIREAPK